MKKHLMMEFLLLYLMLGVLGFLSITYLGSVLIEDYLQTIVTRNLCLEASSIAGNPHLKKSYLNNHLGLVEDDLYTIANYEDADIWVLDADNEIIISVPEMPTKSISSAFHPKEWEPDSSIIGDFYDIFPDQRLSVLAPMYEDDPLEPVGYIMLHYQMSRLYIRRSGALRITQILFVVMYLLSSGMLMFYFYRIHLPLKSITKGASAYANGDLSYQIRVSSSDEMGYLAATLNYMADVLDQNGQYQKEFVSNVSHDFRSPLTSIKGYINAMLDGTIPPEYQERYLTIIASETERLEKLTTSLLSLNELDIKKRTISFSRFDINHMILASFEVFEGISNERDIRLRLFSSEDELFVRADEQQIKQVLYNLIDNALKFSPDHSSIELDTKWKGNKVFVSIEDHGVGIPKDSLPKIWNRFYKTDSSRGKDRKGTGLGLSIVKEIINAHNQQIDVISTEGAGTEFIFTLEKA